MDVAELARDIAELQAANAKLEEERDRYRQLYQQLLEKARKLELGILGQKAERLPASDAQLSLQLLAGLLGERDATMGDDSDADSDATEEPEPKKPRRKPTGRKPIPEHLPVVEIELIPDDVMAKGLEHFDRVGEEVISTIERRPSAFVNCRVVRPKFLPKDRDRLAPADFSIAEPIALPIERGLAGPGLLSETVVRRHGDHMPFHRLEKIYAREGVPLAKSTMCGWHKTMAELCEPLVDAMWSDAIATAPYLCTDATGVLVRDKEKCRRGHFWVVVAPDQHVLFRYTPKHNGAAVDSMLKEYKGVLLADAHSVYDHLYKDGEGTEAGCWAHARRYFFKALFSEPELAREAIALIGKLFKLEQKYVGLTPKKRQKRRQAKSRPVVDAFFDWCDGRAARALDDTPLAKAIGYARNQREALHTFLNDGRIPIHNNRSERELRREAVGRKNWLFVGNDDAGQVNATFVTLIASCEMHGLEPWAYLRDLFCLLPEWPRHRVLELSPARWAETLEDEHTQQRLAADVFRQITLGAFDAQLAQA
jgi:transposase